MDAIILASSSPRRSDLLRQAGIPFKVVPSDIDEENEKILAAPEQMAERLAALKARAVAAKVAGGIVLGADTIVVCGGTIFGKPVDAKDARRMLECLSGREHRVITGLALVNADTGRTIVDHEITSVKFSELFPEEIAAYVETGEPFGKAGAYALQGKGALFVERIDGCYSNVIGLPLNKLNAMLRELGVRVM